MSQSDKDMETYWRAQMLSLKIKPTKADDINVALDLVIDLAEQNVVDRFDNPSEYRRQMTALKLVKQTFSKTGDY